LFAPSLKNERDERRSLKDLVLCWQFRAHVQSSNGADCITPDAVGVEIKTLEHGHETRKPILHSFAAAESTPGWTKSLSRGIFWVAERDGSEIHRISRHEGFEVTNALFQEMIEWLRAQGCDPPDHYWERRYPLEIRSSTKSWVPCLRLQPSREGRCLKLDLLDPLLALNRRFCSVARTPNALKFDDNNCGVW